MNRIRLIGSLCFGLLLLCSKGMAQEAPLDAPVLAEWEVNMPQGFAFGFDSVWVPSHRSPNVTTRIDPATNQVVAVIEGTGYRAHEALIAADQVWVTGENNDLAPIDPATNTVGTGVRGSHPDIAYGFDALWAATPTDKLDRIDPGTSEITTSITIGTRSVDCNSDVVVTSSAVWVLHCGSQQDLVRVDPITNSVVSKTLYTQLVDQANEQTTAPAEMTDESLWFIIPGGLLRVDAETTTGLAFLPLTAEQAGDGWVTIADGVAWVGGDGQIERIDPATNQIGATYIVHSGLAKVGVGFGSVWVSYEFENLVQRLDISP